MVPALPLPFEIGTYIVLVLIIAFDLVIAFRRPHVPKPRESTLWILFYIGLALAFSVLMLVLVDGESAGQFVAGWLTEYSLSIDNLFIFLIIMARFSVPEKYQQELLMIGIIIALVLRLIFIVIGAQLIASFSWVFYIFGVFLVYTAITQARSGHVEGEERESRLIAWLKKRIAITDEFDRARLRTTVDGRRVFTPVLLVIVALGTTDLLFALDSIPAIFGITRSPFIVFTANVFALMGLRQLYFLIGALVERLVYLSYGIAAILAFIGVKLVLTAMHENELPFINGGENIDWAPQISTLTSLGVIVGAMAVAVVASVIRMRYGGGRTLHREPPPEDPRA